MPSLIARDVRVLQDSDLWAIYARTCLSHVLECAARADEAMDEDLEAEEPEYTQPARPAPRRTKRR